MVINDPRYALTTCDRCGLVIGQHTCPPKQTTGFSIPEVGDKDNE